MTIISIIDDNTSILTSLSLQFQSKGYKTITFADPEKALLYHEDKPADAYVIDMKMPKLTGFEFYRDLCAVLNKDKLPALFLTAVDNLEERALKDTTIGDFVLKPYSFNILHARLLKVMSYFAKQKEDMVYRLGNLELLEEQILCKWYGKNIELSFGDYTKPKIFKTKTLDYISITDKQENKLYIFDANGNLVEKFPVFGSSTIDLFENKKSEKFVSVLGEKNEVLIYSFN